MNKLNARLAITCILFSAFTICAWGACNNSVCQNNDKQNQELAAFLKNYKDHNNPDAVAKQYAAQNNISFEEAKKELREKFGNPKRPNNLLAKSNCNPYGLTPEEQGLLEAGVPLDLILEHDDNSIMKFIQENEITDYTEKYDI